MRMFQVLLLFTVVPIGVAFSASEKEKGYPLTTCVVSGEKLGSMGKAFVYAHEGREVRFCCRSCVKDFLKAPAQYLKKLDAAAEKAAVR